MTYLGKGGQIPYLSKEDIVRSVENTLEECWDDEFPVDIEAICDDLKISILPISGLSRTFQVDAFISVDFKSIYVDSKEFEKDSHRYRFSVAHELGHYVLHQKYYPHDIDNLENWIKTSQYFLNNYAEFQANYFAGSLLVPEVDLIQALDSIFNGSFVRNYWNASPKELANILASIRKKFKVSDQVIARRMRDAFPGIDELGNNKNKETR